LIPTGPHRQADDAGRVTGALWLEQQRHAEDAASATDDTPTLAR
jgi:hypothetical protein